MSKNTPLPSQASLAASSSWMWALCITLLVMIAPTTGYSQGSTLLGGLAGKCLDVAGGNPNDGTPIILWPCRKNAPNQLWRFASHSTIRGLAGKCLDVAGGNPNDGTPIILWPCHGGPNQQWHLLEDRTIRGLAGKCLDVARGSSNDGTPIILWPCHGGPNQQWVERVFFD
jgi:Ricin-type beta-trefoil lectin domain